MCLLLQLNGSINMKTENSVLLPKKYEQRQKQIVSVSMTEAISSDT
jgi:hypothetical protein